MVSIQGFQGNSLIPNTKSYDRANNIYASSSFGKERDMNPGEIYQPSSIEDIRMIIKYANQVNKSIAIRTGGHQYSGASSTNQNGIQLDLKPTFRRPCIDQKLVRENGKVYMQSSVSWTMKELYEFLTDNGVFLPTGQCATVCMGGHVQTGGYGMLARSFGLLGDYVVSLDIVDAKGDAYTITKQSHPDLFYGFLGGSPGNFGVLTHFKVEVQEDINHKGSKGLWMAFQYSEKTLKYLLDTLVEKSEDPDFPRGYDFCVNVLSRSINLIDVFPGSEDELRKILPNWVMREVTSLTNFKIALIVVYTQWVNLPSEPAFDPSLFNSIREAPGLKIIEKESGDDWGMSQIMKLWLFTGDREFAYPYIKRANSTNSSTLSEDDFSSWFASRVEKLVEDRKNGLYISSQLQVMGGKNSMHAKHAGNGTAYSWRDTKLCTVWDVFYDQEVTTKQKAAEWQKENDDGAKIHFAKQEYERRLLWGSYGDWNMKDENVWRCYHEEESYRKLQKIKKQVDPKGLFTANPFCVEAAD